MTGTTWWDAFIGSAAREPHCCDCSYVPFLPGFMDLHVELHMTCGFAVISRPLVHPASDICDSVLPLSSCQASDVGKDPCGRRPRRLGGGKGAETRAFKEPKNAAKRISSGLPPTPAPAGPPPIPPRSHSLLLLC